MTEYIWQETFCDSHSGVAADSFVASYRRCLILPGSLATCKYRRHTAEWNKRFVRPVAAFGGTGAGVEAGVNTDADVAWKPVATTVKVMGLVLQT